MTFNQLYIKLYILFIYHLRMGQLVDLNIVKYGTSGGIAGIIMEVLFYPIQTLKTRMMGSSSAQNLIKQTKSISLYKGISSKFIGTFPSYFTFFFVYETIRKYRQKSHLSDAIAAFTAQGVSNIIRNPIELIKQQIMVGRQRHIIQSIKNIVKNKGIKGFYTGYSPTLIHNLTFSTIQMPIYQAIKHPIASFLGYNNSQDPIICSMAGTVSMIISGTLTTPIDVVKTRQMTRHMKQKIQILRMIKQIWSQSGFFGFFKGIHFRLFGAIFGGITYFYVFGKSNQLLQVKNIE